MHGLKQDLVTIGALLATCTGTFAQVVIHESIQDTMPASPAGPVMLRPAPLVVEGPFVSVQINTDPTTGMDVLNDAANETSITRSLTNPDIFMIGWRQFDSVHSSYRKSGYAYSHDGGTLWSGRRVLDETRQGSDPILVAGPDGEIYYNSYRFSEFPFGTEVYSTANGGLSWSGPFNAFGGDKAWMTVDISEGLNRGAIYQMWSDAANVSFDGGTTWSAATAGVSRWGTMTVGPDGRCYNAGRALKLLEADASNPLAPPVPSPLDPLPYQNPQAFLSVVNPAGIEGQNNVAVSLAPDERYNEVYVLQSARGLRGDSIGPATDVFFAYSTNLGNTFSEAIRVNDTVPETSWQWFGTFSVAPNGRIDATWNDTRDDPVDPLGLPTTSRLNASYSTDGGRTWAPNFPVSPMFDHRIGYPGQGKLGDYYSMVSDDLGAHVAYAATFTGGQDVYYLNIGGTDCDANGVPDDMEIAAGEAIDLDGDGIPDVCGCIADLTGDGTINLDDIDAFVAAFLAGDAAADLDGSGVINFDDIDLFVASFLLGCD